MIRDLLDGVARRLGYVSVGTFADLNAQLRRERESADAVIANYARQVDDLKGLLAAAGRDHDRSVAYLSGQLAIRKALAAEHDSTLHQHARLRVAVGDFRAALARIGL